MREIHQCNCVCRAVVSFELFDKTYSTAAPASLLNEQFKIQIMRRVTFNRSKDVFSLKNILLAFDRCKSGEKIFFRNKIIYKTCWMNKTAEQIFSMTV